MNMCGNMPAESGMQAVGEELPGLDVLAAHQQVGLGRGDAAACAASRPPSLPTITQNAMKPSASSTSVWKTLTQIVPRMPP